MSVKNFYEDVLAICKYLDEQEGNQFHALQFKFSIASKPMRGNAGSWRLDDERGGVHYFEFQDQSTLYYKNSIIEDRTPPLILEPIAEHEMVSIVDEMKSKLARGEPYKPFPYEKRKVESPIPGVAWLKEK